MSDASLRTIQRCLISVSDKTGLVPLAQSLRSFDIEILSSGGTAAFLRDQKIEVTEISDYTQAPEILGGRVKTLHPKIHAGILANRSKEDHLAALESLHYLPIDAVVVNLYPFEATVEKEGVTLEEAIEKIDIGGPTMLRAAAKNFQDVCVLHSPEQYTRFTKQLMENQGATTYAFRQEMCKEVFQRSARYDLAIAQHLSKSEEGQTFQGLALKEKLSLRYGENPHQKASFYLPYKKQTSISDGLLQGKALSYNNLIDAHAALRLISDFQNKDVYTVGIFKHTNPCGVGTSNTSLLDAYQKALSCDPVSAFGLSLIHISEPTRPY